jgi:hypothetical protein
MGLVDKTGGEAEGNRLEGHPEETKGLSEFQSNTNADRSSASVSEIQDSYETQPFPILLSPSKVPQVAELLSCILEHHGLYLGQAASYSGYRFHRFPPSKLDHSHFPPQPLKFIIHSISVVVKALWYKSEGREFKTQ